jgi:cyclopropane-fatty-acyl-phospholipid synthase
VSATLTTRLASTAIDLAEAGRLPDPVVAAGIRGLLRARLRSLNDDAGEAVAVPTPSDRIAVSTDAANRQHYEVPAAFFQLVLGRHLKYSCCDWTGGAATLDAAEERMLARTMERAALEPGQRVLDLGCGWGSFTLHAAAAYPDSRFLAVSNSRSQIEFIRDAARERQLSNVEARVADVNQFHPEARFDRIVSVEMMEHVRNHGELMRRLSGWLAGDGRLFVHVFGHRKHAYTFEADGPADWMAREFFTGGTMPSMDTIPAAAAGFFETEAAWRVEGTEYARTADAWLQNLDARRTDALRVLGEAGASDPHITVQRWRLFFLAVRETFAYRDGVEWLVGHYRLRPARGTR